MTQTVDRQNSIIPKDAFPQHDLGLLREASLVRLLLFFFLFFFSFFEGGDGEQKKSITNDISVERVGLFGLAVF